MLITECTPVDELFSHCDLEGVERHFNATAMIREILKGTVTPTFMNLALYEELVKHVESQHGVEQDHLEHITNLDSPILVVEFDGGDNLIVDGNHRVVKRWRNGLRDVKAAILKPGQWEQFLVTGINVPRELYAPKVES